MKTALALVPALLLMAACSDKAGQPAAETDHAQMDHSMHGGGATSAPLTEAQAAYKAANDTMHAEMGTIPEDPDVAFMQGMLAHHKGAVAMSEVALKYGKDEQARDLARRIIAAQQAEIDEIEAWLKAKRAQ